MENYYAKASGVKLSIKLLHHESTMKVYWSVLLRSALASAIEITHVAISCIFSAYSLFRCKSIRGQSGESMPSVIVRDMSYLSFCAS